MAGIFSPQTLEQIRAASDIVEVIGGYVPLKRAGASFVALCPFHKEKTPSFHVNPHRQIFHCFGCHKGGDVFTFVKEYENIPFPDAVRRLAERARIPLEFDQNPAHKESREIKDQLLKIHEQITQRWQNALANEAAGQVARDYLAKRGVSEEAIKLFRLGAAPEAWDDTVNWAKSKGFELAVVEKAGLILRKEGSENFYDRFRGRLMFPICDEQGRVIGFSGRVLAGDEKTAKYVNSPETPIFTKSKVFYGLDKSKRALLDAGHAVICEGQLDLIACFMAGVRNVVAPQGTAFTAEHARLLKRYVDEVVLCFDSDDAGQDAAVRSLDHLLASGLAVRVAIVPAPHDPDSFIKTSGGEAFRQLIEKADDFFGYYLKRLCQQNNPGTDRGRLAVLRAMAEAVHKTGNAVLVDNYAQKTALRLAVSPDAVRTEFKKLATSRPTLPTGQQEEGSDAAEANLEDDESSEFFQRELWLLEVVLTRDDLLDWVAEQLEVEWIMHDRIRQVVRKRLDLLALGEWQGTAAFISTFEDMRIQALITRAIVSDRKRHEAEEMVKGTAHKPSMLRLLRDRWIERELGRITLALGQPDHSDEERVALLRRQLMLREQKKTPLPLPNGVPS